MKYININCVASLLKPSDWSQYIPHILAILVSTSRLHPREIVKMSLNKIRIFDLSKCLSFHTICTLTKSIGQSLHASLT